MSEFFPAYKVRVEQVISGDDIVVLAELVVDDLFKKVRCRLEGVDTPDGYKQSGSSPAGKIRDTVKRLTKGYVCSVEVKSQNRKDWIVQFYIHDGDDKLNLNSYLQSLGYVYSPDRSNAKEKSK